jgi:hypothetical protein
MVLYESYINYMYKLLIKVCALRAGFTFKGAWSQGRFTMCLLENSQNLPARDIRHPKVQYRMF